MKAKEQFKVGTVNPVKDYIGQKLVGNYTL